MVDSGGSASGRIVELDFTPPNLDETEWAEATRIVKEQLSPDYDLAIDPGEQQPVILSVPEEDISPSWETLRTHSAEVVDTIEKYEDPPLPSFADDEAADLRVYPLWRNGQSKTDDPGSVVISMKMGKVVSFNESAPEPERGSGIGAGPPQPRSVIGRLFSRIGSWVGGVGRFR